MLSISNSFMESGVYLNLKIISNKSLKSWCLIRKIRLIYSFLESLLEKIDIMIIIPITPTIILRKIFPVKLLLIFKSSIGKLILICLYLPKISSHNKITKIKNYTKIFKKSFLIYDFILFLTFIMYIF
jgi:uncharacterized protein YqhQ